MKKLLFILVLGLLIGSTALAQLTPAEKTYVNETLWPATGLLYVQTAEGAMDMRCTATAIDQDDKSYTFVTAAHCGCVDDASKNLVAPQKAFFFISPDVVGNKLYLKATVKGCGFRTKGDDFFLLTTDKTVKFPVVPLGQDPKIMDAVINVGSPLGLGKQVFLGSVSSPMLDRPVVQDDIQWTNAVLLQEFGVNGGSSGSSVICVDQKAICAFVVGSIAETSMIAMPVSRLVKFREALAAGKYKWYVNDPDSPLISPQKDKPPQYNIDDGQTRNHHAD